MTAEVPGPQVAFVTNLTDVWELPGVYGDHVLRQN